MTKRSKNLTKNFIQPLTFFILLFAAAGAVALDDLIHYDHQGNIAGRYACDKVHVHQSPHQDTLICKKTPKRPLKVSLAPVEGDYEAKQCADDRMCVLIVNPRDPSWLPLRLDGVPDASFGPNAQGKSCVRIQEPKPHKKSWARDVIKLCTNNPNVELAYTFALGYQHENIAQRFKQADAKRVCFDQALRGYKGQRFWTDNCLFVRYR